MVSTRSRPRAGTGFSWDLFSPATGDAPTPPPMDNAALGIGESAAEGVSGDAIRPYISALQIGETVYRIVVALTLLYLVISLVITGINLAAYGDNPQMRSKTISDLRRTLIALAIIGSIEALAGLILNAFHTSIV